MFNLLRGDITIEQLVMRLIAVIIALTIHEFAHGFASYRLGDGTAKYDGRLSFNPLRHIDPIGMLLIVLVGFGWAKPVMVDPRNLRKPKRDMAIISAAGPLSNFILAFLVLLLYVPLVIFGDGSITPLVAMFLLTLVHINIILGVFNLIPIPPLDGSKILAVFLPNHLYWRYTSFRHGFIVLIILIVTDIASMIIGPVVVAIYSGYLFVIIRLLSLIL